MDLANNGAKYGADQYRFAHNYDLKKEIITITADKEYVLTFAGRDKLTLNSGTGAEVFDYECLKLETDTYFVRFGSGIVVLELSLGFAAFVLPTGYVCGSIKLPEQAAPDIYPGMTEEMTGTAVRWVFGCDKYVNHIYCSADKCRAAWSPEGDRFTNYPASYLKIKDGIYLVDVKGLVPERACAPSGSDRLILLEDYEHMMLVGCVFGTAHPLMISGYGEFPEFD